MDQRILLVALGAAALALAGTAFAFGGQGWAAQGGQIEGWNATAKGGGMMRIGAPEWAGNGTCARRLNASGTPRFNETSHSEFVAAVESGDFAAATKLHEEYGFGGQMFEKLNETTFAKFSQLHKLQSELFASLGIEKMPGAGMMGGEGFGRMQGCRGMDGRGTGMHRQTE